MIARDLDEAALAALQELYARFEASRAAWPDHYYLSLLATHPDHRYVRAGFALDGGFAAVRDDAWISAMWRPVGGAR